MSKEDEMEQRGRPELSPEVLDRLWSVLEPHAIPSGSLGDYASLLRRRGEPHARRELPYVAAHLDSGCQQCQEDLHELLEFVEAEIREQEAMARAARPAPAPSEGWLPAFLQGLRFSFAPIGDEGAPSEAHEVEDDAPPWLRAEVLKAAPALPTLDFQLPSQPDITLQASPLDAGSGLRIVHVDESTEPDQGLGGWRIRITTPGSNRAIEVITNRSGAAAVPQIPFDALMDAVIEVRPLGSAQSETK